MQTHRHTARTQTRAFYCSHVTPVVKHGEQLCPLPSTLNLERIANPMGNCRGARTGRRLFSVLARVVYRGDSDHEVAPKRGMLNGIMGMWDRGLRIFVSAPRSPMPPAIAINSLWSNVISCYLRCDQPARFQRNTPRICYLFCAIET